MIKYTEIKGALIENEDGKINGVVEDCLINIKLLKVCSLMITVNGIIPSCALIPFWKIKSFGKKVVFSGRTIAVKKKELDGIEHSVIGRYFGKEIVYFPNKGIGDLTEVIIEEETGKIKALIASRGIVDDVVDGRRVIITDDKTSFEMDRIIIQESQTNIVNEISLKKILRG
jgi:uncharacterized protein YrrD